MWAFKIFNHEADKQNNTLDIMMIPPNLMVVLSCCNAHKTTRRYGWADIPKNLPKPFNNNDLIGNL